MSNVAERALGSVCRVKSTPKTNHSNHHITSDELIALFSKEQKDLAVPHPAPRIPLTAAEFHQHFHATTQSEIEQFIAQIPAGTYPAWDEGTNRVTFLFAHPNATDASSVHLHINRITDKQNYARGVMERVGTSSLFVLELPLPPTLRASYGFVPSDVEAQTATPGSVIAGPLAPDQQDYSYFGSIDPERLKFTTMKHTGASDAFAHKPVWLYLPPDTAQQSVALVVLFDGEKWFEQHQLAQAFDSAINAGAIAPIVVVSVGNVDQADRLSSLGCHDEFADAISNSLCEWARRTAREQGHEIAHDRTIIAGQSLGGLTALWAHLRYPERYAAVVAQSPSLWWSPAGNMSPSTWGSRIRDWFAEESDRFPATPGVPIRLSVGAQEQLSVARVAQLQLLWQARGWDCSLNIIDGGHDYAWWRGDLLAALGELTPGWTSQ